MNPQSQFPDRYPPRAALEAAFQAVRRAKVPQVPDVVLGLREELARAEPRFQVAADLVAQDLALSGQVMKTINSPLFSCRTKIGSLRQAVTMMGIDRLTNLVTAQAFNRARDAATGPARVVWDSIMEQAHATLAVSRVVEGASSEEAYLFGIMQDAGSLIFADLLPGYGAEWTLRRAEPQSLLDYERSAMGVDHTTVGFLLAGNWRLPEPVALAIYHHHSADVTAWAEPRVRSLIAMAKLAHYLIALSHATQEMPEMLVYRDTARQELNLSDEDWSVLQQESLERGWSQR